MRRRRFCERQETAWDICTLPVLAFLWTEKRTIAQRDEIPLSALSSLTDLLAAIVCALHNVCAKTIELLSASVVQERLLQPITANPPSDLVIFAGRTRRQLTHDKCMSVFSPYLAADSQAGLLVKQSTKISTIMDIFQHNIAKQIEHSSGRLNLPLRVGVILDKQMRHASDSCLAV